MKLNKTVKNILGRIFTVWGGLMFIGTMLIIIIPAWATKFIKEPKRTSIFIQICRIWMYIFYPLAFIRVKISGHENFKPDENYIVVCNHNSMMDVPITSPGIPGANKTIAKIELSRTPLFGIIYKRGSVLIDRKNESSRKDSYNKMKWVLEQGMHMCIYPEGTRNKTNDPLKSFHDGAFRLSFDTGKSIIPAILTGTKKMLPSDKAFFFWPGKITMRFLAPISPTTFSNQTEMKDHVFEVMWREIEKEKSDVRGQKTVG
jgi:1-acyl-sn-glycerol-3-phosphate acyltransferase